MIKRFGAGYFAITIEAGRPKYTKREVLENSTKREYEIIKQKTGPQETEWICYSYIKNGKETAFIRGYLIEKNRFHIQRIKNLLKDRISGSRYIPKIFYLMERDLKKQNIQELTTSAILKLAPISMKKFGFSTLDGQTYKDVKKNWFKIFPWVWKPLKKTL